MITISKVRLINASSGCDRSPAPGGNRYVSRPNKLRVVRMQMMAAATPARVPSSRPATNTMIR